jgi:hypothetical protein
LESGKTYFFAVTAINNDGLESDFSKDIKNKPPPGNSMAVVGALYGFGSARLITRLSCLTEQHLDTRRGHALNTTFRSRSSKPPP